MKIITEKGDFSIVSILIVIIIICAIGWCTQYNLYKQAEHDLYEYSQRLEETFADNEEVLEKIEKLGKELLLEKQIEYNERKVY